MRWSGSAGRWCLGIWGDRVSAARFSGNRGYAGGRLGRDVMDSEWSSRLRRRIKKADSQDNSLRLHGASAAIQTYLPEPRGSQPGIVASVPRVSPRRRIGMVETVLPSKAKAWMFGM